MCKVLIIHFIFWWNYISFDVFFCKNKFENTNPKFLYPMLEIDPSEFSEKELINRTNQSAELFIDLLIPLSKISVISNLMTQDFRSIIKH